MAVTPVIVPMDTCYDCPPPTHHEVLIITFIAVFIGVLLCAWGLLNAKLRTGKWNPEQYAISLSIPTWFGWMIGVAILGCTAACWLIYLVYLLAEAIL